MNPVELIVGVGVSFVAGRIVAGLWMEWFERRRDRAETVRLTLAATLGFRPGHVLRVGTELWCVKKIEGREMVCRRMVAEECAWQRLRRVWRRR